MDWLRSAVGFERRRIPPGSVATPRNSSAIPSSPLLALRATAISILDGTRETAHYSLKIDLGSMAWIPLVPSTVCVTLRSTATEQRM
jgi:hypothetical protein